MATRTRGGGTGSAAAFLDDFAEEVLDELDAAAAAPLHPGMASVCAEASGLAGRVHDAGVRKARRDARGFVIRDAERWLDGTGASWSRRLGGLSVRELDILNGCIGRVEDRLARLRDRLGDQPRGPPSGLDQLRAAIRRRLRLLGAPFPWPARR